MEIKYSKNKIELEKELNALDKLAIKISTILNKQDIKHVIVSGYICILFGRSRSSENIDIIIEKIGPEKFEKLWKETKNKELHCINAQKPKEAYNEYLTTGVAIRLSKKDEFIPNIEMKFPKNELDAWTLKQRKQVLLNSHKLFIPPWNYKYHSNSSSEAKKTSRTQNTSTTLSKTN